MRRAIQVLLLLISAAMLPAALAQPVDQSESADQPQEAEAQTNQGPAPATAAEVKDEIPETESSDDERQRAEDRDQKNLVAQQTIAEMAQIQTILGAISLVAAVGAAIFAGLAWRSSNQAARVATEALYSVERPVILIQLRTDRSAPPERASGSPVFCISVSNVGKAQAFVTAAAGHFVCQKTGDPIPQPDGIMTASHACMGALIEQRSLIPGEPPKEIYLQRATPLTNEERLGLTGRDLISYFTATVVYADTLRKLRRDAALFVYDPVSADFPNGRFVHLMTDEKLLTKADHKTHMAALRTMLSAQIPILWSALKRGASGKA